MNALSLIPLSAALCCFAIGVVVRLSYPRTELKAIFCFHAATLVFFNMFFFILSVVDDHDLAFSLARVMRVGSLLLTPTVVCLSVALSGAQRSLPWRFVLAIDYFLASIFIFGNALDLFVSHLDQVPWGYTTVPTPYYQVLTVYTVVNAILASGLVAYQFFSARTPRVRTQSRFWMLGIVVGLVLGLTNFLPPYGVPIYPLGNLGTAAFSAIVAYAIVRHRLMDIDVVLTKGISFSLVAILFIGPLLAVAIAAQRWSFGSHDQALTTTILFLLLVCAALFPRLQSLLERRVASSLFREKQEARSSLARFAKSISRVFEEDELLRQLEEAIVSTFQLSRLSIYLWCRDLGVLKYHSPADVRGDGGAVNIDKRFIDWLSKRNETAISGEEQFIGDEGTRKVIERTFAHNAWQAVVPLVSGDCLSGVIALGEKSTREQFSTTEIDLLNDLAAHAALGFENVRLYEKLRVSQGLIDRADRLSSLGTFAAGIAHEIRNPLVSIQTFFQLAPDRVGDKEFFSSFLSLAEGEVERIRRLIDELLSFARSGTQQSEEVPVEEVVERAVTLLSPHANEKGVRVRLSLPEAKLKPVLGGEDQLMQVIVNIVLNAIQASVEGGLVDVTVTTSARIGEEWVRVEIADEGCGIPESQREAIFDPFHTTKNSGTGLGLAIAHRIVSDYGGTLTLESGSSAGTCFAIDLPTCDVSIAANEY